MCPRSFSRLDRRVGARLPRRTQCRGLCAGRSLLSRRRDFAGPAELAAYLNWLDEHDEAYQRYFAWKRMGLSASFRALVASVRVHRFVGSARSCRTRLLPLAWRRSGLPMRRNSVLYVTPIMPQRSGNGLAMRAANVLEALARRFAVHLFVVPVAGTGGRPTISSAAMRYGPAG